MKENFDYTKYKNEMNQPGKWVYIAPVSGVVLTEAVNYEFRIKRVLLVDKKKLPRIRKRIGLPRRISQLRSIHWLNEFFSSTATFAVTWLSGVPPTQAKKKCRKIVKDELSILALSQLGFSKRRYGAYPLIKGEPHSGVVEEFVHSTDDHRHRFSGQVVGKIDNLRLDGLWKNFHKQGFFFRLLQVLNGEIKVSRNWRNIIERAAILIGQSLCSTDVPQSFLWNMIALELLLTEQNDKYADELSKRAEAFLGWVGFWETNHYAEKIANVYKKRCALVHEGKRDEIEVADLLFTDDLLFNLLVNLFRHINLFTSRKDVIDFSRRVEAEHILGVRPKVRPKSLVYISRKYTEKDLEEI